MRYVIYRSAEGLKEKQTEAMNSKARKGKPKQQATDE
jgi:hypothetical protein